MDLDRGGGGSQQTRVWLGPSLGWTMELVQPTKTITTGGTYEVLPGDSLILVDFNGSVSIQLPDVRTWIQQNGYQPATAFERDISVKDAGGFAATHNISIVPFGTQEIDGANQAVLLDQAKGIIKLSPLYDLSGWIVESKTIAGGGGGGGDVFKAGNNTFTGINQFLSTIQVPTVGISDDSLNAASTAFVKDQGYITLVDLSPYALLNSPTFIGIPRAPTPAAGDNDTKIATTAFVQTELADYQPLDADLTALSNVTGMNDIYFRSGTSTWSPVVMGANMSFAGGVLDSVGGGGGGIITSVNPPFTAPGGALTLNYDTSDFFIDGSNRLAFVNNASLPGTPTIGVSPNVFDNSLAIASTAWVRSYTVSAYQPLDGDLTAISALTGTNTIYYRSGVDTWSPVTMGGNMTFVGGVLDSVGGGGGGIPEAPNDGLYYARRNLGWANVAVAFAPLASPTFTGDPKAPTPATADNDTSIATTAFVKAQNYGNVSNSGTPTNGQFAQWTDATHIQGVDASAMPFVIYTGDTMIGDLTISKTDATMKLDATGTNDTAGYHLSNGGLSRWAAFMDGVAESGGNAGSNFNIGRFNDAGAFLDIPISIARNTGLVTVLGDPTAALGIATKQYVDSAAGAVMPPACGRFRYDSATTVKFVTYNGDKVRIAGVLYSIPVLGISAVYNNCFIDGVGGQTLAGGTLYYAYLFVNAGTPTIDFSATGHGASGTPGNVGTEVKIGDNTRTLIGMVFTNSGASSGQFVDLPSSRFVVSWFNRRNLALQGPSQTRTGYTSTAVDELGLVTRAYWLNWAEEGVFARAECLMTSAVFSFGQVHIGLDGTTNVAPGAAVATVAASGYAMLGTSASFITSEGFHWVVPVIASPGGTAVDYTGWATGTIRG